MGRSRRLSKKLHREYLVDVLYGISVSNAWRARLYEAGMGHEFLLDAETLVEVPSRVHAALRKYRLRYTGAWVPHEWTRGWAGYEHMVMFRVRALQFPELVEYSANNPKTIHGKPDVRLD